MNAPPDPVPPVAAPAPSAQPRRSPALALAVVALVLTAAGWLTHQSRINSLREEVAVQLDRVNTQSNESRALARHAQEATVEAQAKLALLEQKLAESQSQQLALEALYQELARGRDEVVVAEIEQLLLSASHELQLAGNVRAALIALQAADARLQRLDRPQLLPLRRAIGKDVERLRAAPLVDVAGLSLKLDGLIELADTLPLLPGQPRALTQAPAAPGSPARWWQRFAREAWEDLTHLVRIQHLGRSELPLIAPEQAYFARENLKLRLLAARLALLARDEQSYKADLAAAQRWLVDYYDGTDRRVQTAAALLRQLSASNVRVDVPDIAGSLAAVRNFKPAPDRGVR